MTRTKTAWHVIWRPLAEADLDDIVDFIAQHNPRAAIRMDELFGAAVGRLAEHPLMGRHGQSRVPAS